MRWLTSGEAKISMTADEPGCTVMTAAGDFWDLLKEFLFFWEALMSSLWLDHWGIFWSIYDIDANFKLWTAQYWSVHHRLKIVDMLRNIRDSGILSFSINPRSSLKFRPIDCVDRECGKIWIIHKNIEALTWLALSYPTHQDIHLTQICLNSGHSVGVIDNREGF